MIRYVLLLWIFTFTLMANMELYPKKEPCTHRRKRSNMMLNPLQLKHLNRIDESKADMITLNLEDAIAPSRKKRGSIQHSTISLSHEAL